MIHLWKPLKHRDAIASQSSVRPRDVTGYDRNEINKYIDT